MKNKLIIWNYLIDLMEKNNIFLIPDFIEKQLYKTSFTIVFFFLSRIINDLKITFLHHLIDIQLKPVSFPSENE